MKYYVHGAGRSGEDAWPAQRHERAVFADHSPCTTMAGKARAVAEHAPSDPAVVVAHSVGAVAAEVAARTGTLRWSAVVLVEPALYDMARGDEAIEGHIGPMTQALDRARLGDLYGCWQILAPMMFGRSASPDTWEQDRPVVQRFVDQEPPWGHDVDAETFRATPTLVITGAWNDEYEIIASQLAQVGAEHAHLSGFQHRPQDHPDFGSVVDGFELQQRLS